MPVFHVYTTESHRCGDGWVSVERIVSTTDTLAEALAVVATRTPCWIVEQPERRAREYRRRRTNIKKD